MTEPQSRDDVDVFISPRRFGGRTPCAQATMQKVFEEERAKSESQSAEKDDDTFEGVRYKYDSSGSKRDFTELAATVMNRIVSYSVTT